MTLAATMGVPTREAGFVLIAGGISALFLGGSAQLPASTSNNN